MLSPPSYSLESYWSAVEAEGVQEQLDKGSFSLWYTTLGSGHPHGTAPSASHGHSPDKRRAFSIHDGGDTGSTCRDTSVMGLLLQRRLVVNRAGVAWKRF